MINLSNYSQEYLDEVAVLIAAIWRNNWGQSLFSDDYHAPKYLRTEDFTTTIKIWDYKLEIPVYIFNAFVEEYEGREWFLLEYIKTKRPAYR